ncbi:hypothetical protein ACTFIR_009460 [Dictyostelium discoideum]
MKYLYQKINNNNNIFNDFKILITLFKIYIFPIIYSIGLYFLTVFIISIIPIVISISLLWIIENVGIFKKSTLLVGLKNIFHIIDILITTITCKYCVMLLCDLIKININNFQIIFNNQINEIIIILIPFFISILTILILIYKLKLILFLNPIKINQNNNNNNLSFFKKTIKFKSKQWMVYIFIFSSFIFFKLFHNCFLFSQNKIGGTSKLLCNSFDNLSPTLTNEVIYFGYYGNNALLFIIYLVLTTTLNKINQNISKKIKFINKTD